MNTLAPASRPHAWLAFIVMASFLAFEMALQVSPSVMTNSLMRDLSLTHGQLGWVSGVYFITYAAMQIPAGLVFMRYPFKWVAMAALLMCVLGAALFALATNMWMAGLARMVMGCGSAFAFLSVLVVVARLFPSDYFPILAGVTQLLAALGCIFGQAGIASVVHSVGWRPSLWGFVGIAVVVMLFVFLLPKLQQSLESRSASAKQGLQHVIRQPRNWLIFAYAALLWAPIVIFAALWGVPYLTAVYHIEPVRAAHLTSLMFVGVGIASPLAGRWVNYIGDTEKVMRWCAMIGTVAAVLLVSTWFQSRWILGGLIFLCGAACAGQVMSFNLIKRENPERYHSVAIGFNNMGVVLSGLITQPLIGFLVQRSLLSQGSEANAYAQSLWVMPGCFALGVGICWLIRRGRA